MGRKASDGPGAKDHLAGVGAQEARQQAEHGGLARTVGPDEPDDLTLAHREGQVLHGVKAAEALVQSRHLEQGHWSESREIGSSRGWRGLGTRGSVTPGPPRKPSYPGHRPPWKEEDHEDEGGAAGDQVDASPTPPRREAHARDVRAGGQE